eukprot:TRINITY_DN4824_c0_g1_i1.p1 TRINITY_DN4824_c0_g1~~TRINITY_DN4824_c0_g1_i1.p1  ORF type:complete len:225 (-),score=57.88 TRINITY_DN4824_c0_g1_i1:58-732(-)
MSTHRENEFVTAVSYHPCHHDVFITAGTTILCWDQRTAKSTGEYRGSVGQILSMCFMNGGGQFVTCSDTTRRSSIDKSVLVWDFESRAILSNQVYTEAYTCTCVKPHPRDRTFLAQSNGDYVAIFSSRPPYRMNKFKRYQGHRVSGYPVGFDVSSDGAVVASGSADGSVHLYDAASARTLRVLQQAQARPRGTAQQAVVDVAWRPCGDSTLAAASWDGAVAIFR